MLEFDLTGWGGWVKIGCISIGVLILISNFLKLSALKAWFNNIIKKDTVMTHEQEFLELIATWYRLRDQCNDCELTEASKKMDELFPLLNNKHLLDPKPVDLT